MIRCYVDQNQKNWDEHLPLLTSAYRSSPHAVTGFTPNRLMLGREVHQPQDIQCGTAVLKADRMEVADFLYNLEAGLRETQNKAREHLRTAQERQKRTYDVRTREHSYSVGDLVYVKDDTRRKGWSPKLQAPWQGPLIVSACRGPVLYEIQGRKRCKIMHHDRLKPYDSDMVPAWARRLRSQVLQRSQCPATQPTEGDTLLEVELPQEKDTARDPEKSGASQAPCERELSSQPKTLGCQQQKKQEDKHVSEDTVKTSRGRIVHKPERYRE